MWALTRTGKEKILLHNLEKNIISVIRLIIKDIQEKWYPVVAIKLAIAIFMWILPQIT